MFASTADNSSYEALNRTLGIDGGEIPAGFHLLTSCVYRRLISYNGSGFRLSKCFDGCCKN